MTFLVNRFRAVLVLFFALALFGSPDASARPSDPRSVPAAAATAAVSGHWAPGAWHRFASAPNDANHAPFAGEVWNRTELYFGTQRPDAPAVTEAEFRQFVDAAVTPRFPDGLTLLTGFGQFRNAAGEIIKEQSLVLILLYPLSERDAPRKIQAIRRAYKDAFQQESVLRVDSFARVSF